MPYDSKPERVSGCATLYILYNRLDTLYIIYIRVAARDQLMDLSS